MFLFFCNPTKGNLSWFFYKETILYTVGSIFPQIFVYFGKKKKLCNSRKYLFPTLTHTEGHLKFQGEEGIYM